MRRVRRVAARADELGLRGKHTGGGGREVSSARGQGSAGRAHAHDPDGRKARQASKQNSSGFLHPAAAPRLRLRRSLGFGCAKDSARHASGRLRLRFWWYWVDHLAVCRPFSATRCPPALLGGAAWPASAVSRSQLPASREPRAAAKTRSTIFEPATAGRGGSKLGTGHGCLYTYTQMVKVDE